MALPAAAPSTPSTPSVGFWVRQTPRILGRALVGFVLDRGSQMAAAISYYALFSMFPLTLLAVSVFGIVLRNQPFQDRVLAAIVDILPVENETMAEALHRVANLGPTLTFVSAIVTLWTAAALSASLRNALNVVFAVEQGRPYLRGKAVDFLLMPVLGLPFIGGVALTTAWRVVVKEVGDRWTIFDGWLGWVWAVGFLAIPFGLTFVAFLLTFWLLPNRRLAFRYLWPGALVTTLLFEALKQLFAVYVHTIATFDAIYGPLSSIIVLLFWVYLTATIVVFGAEVSAALPGLSTGGRGAGDWRRSTFTFLRGLVMAPENEVRHPVEQAQARIAGGGGAASRAEARRRE